MIVKRAKQFNKVAYKKHRNIETEANANVRFHPVKFLNRRHILQFKFDFYQQQKTPHTKKRERTRLFPTFIQIDCHFRQHDATRRSPGENKTRKVHSSDNKKH